jgi:hypothetical protein
VVGVFAVAPPAYARGGELAPMSAKMAVAQMKRGVRLDHVLVKGRVSLNDATLTWPFECTNCRFVGPVSARNAVFMRRVDLAGATFTKTVQMVGASFAGSASFGSTIAPSHFRSGANFTLATFGDTADFENVSFGDATFDLAHFKGDAIFAGGTFNAAFEGPTSFQRTSFAGTADFRDRVFEQTPDFTEATFAGRSDFSGLTEFKHGATFDETAFGPETSFLAAKFEGEARSGDVTIFDHVTSSGTIDFSAATISAPLRILKSVVGGLTFAQTLYRSGGTLTLDSDTAPSFYLDISSLPHVKGADASSTVNDRETALALLEASAKSDNNLSLANDAHYRLESLKSTQYREPFHLLDLFFYNWIAGYLVRPDHPIFTLLVIALLVSLVRAFILIPEPRTAGEPSRIRPELTKRGEAVGATLAEITGRFGIWLHTSVRPGFTHFGHELLDTFRLILPGSGAAAKGRRAEAFAYRALIVCMLIGFANSNPTLRQMLDALL